MIVGSLSPFYLACGWLLTATAVVDPTPFAVEVRSFTFDNAEDRDYDGQPDDWSRRGGAGFPRYVEASIDRGTGRGDRQSLKFVLNGGQAAYYSPLVRINPDHSYVVHGYIRTEGLVHDAAFLSVSLLNHKRERIQRGLSRLVGGTHADWVRLEIGPISPSSDVRFLVVGCHVAHRERMDIHGTVWFDDIHIGSLPRLGLTTSSSNSFFRPHEPIQLQADVQGLDPRSNYLLTMRLETGQGQLLATKTFPLSAAQRAERDSPLAPIVWDLDPQPNGSYRGCAILEREGNVFVEKTATFAVMEPPEPTDVGEFGWSLPHGAGEMPLSAFAETAGQGGINWLKFPLWSAADPQRAARSSEITKLMQQLERRGITVVGMLNDPPEALVEKFAYNWEGVSKIFMLPPEIWYPTLEPVIARYSFHVRHWQLGDESDSSFLGMPSLGATLAGVKREFDRIGRDVHIGIHWDWDNPLPRGSDTPNTFYSISNPQPLDYDSLVAALRNSRSRKVPRWVLLQPLPEEGHTHDQRAADLVRRIVAAKAGEADAIFVSNPFDRQRGLLYADGSPTELFLPWRTTALALRGARYLGRLTLRRHSENAVFTRGGEGIVVLWSNSPVRERVCFGEKAEVLDLWGRRQRLESDPSTGQQFVDVGPVPIIIRNAVDPLLRWQMAVKYEKGRLSSEYGGHADALLGSNPFPQGVSGTVSVQLPRDWKVEPQKWDLQLGVNEAYRLPIVLSFPPDTSLGTIPTTLEFEISADRPYRFSVYRPYQVGLGDITLEASSRLLPDGRLEIEQRIENRTEPPEIMNFNCSLFIPGRRRQRQTVTKLGPGVDHKFYYVPDAAALEGHELWIRAEQSNGNRVLNYKFLIGE